MSDVSKTTEKDRARGMDAPIDLVLGLGVTMLASVSFAILGGEFEAKPVLITLAFMALIMLVARLHGMSIGTYWLGLREKPSDLASREAGDGMNPGDRNFYRPAILWGIAAGVAAFIAEYVANDGTLGRALLWAALAAILVGLFFARLLGMRDGRQTRPRRYAERQIDAPEPEREPK